ncbi:hypothetical protein [Prosthecobacter fluviatilis]|uniref:Uncharacterized protein n=1 Tax=Prosthecobacter fluviatilis TaxID=445931 RepID=A0ABW0KTK6_9BACT
MSSISCPECTQPMRDDMERCPHCYRPCLYPNVTATRRQEEVEALNRRYDEAIALAVADGCEPMLRDFEKAVSSSEAVICRSFGELQRLSYSEDEIYATFYQRVDAGLRLAGGDAYDTLRSMADTALFGEQNKRHVRFASLTLNGRGMPHYGDCSLLLREEMIAHRTSVLEENSVMFMHRHNIGAGNDYKIPSGYRATWLERGRLAVAKTRHPKTLHPSTFPTDLQRSGADERKDVFIEAHVWGSLTIRSIQQVRVTAWRGAPPSQAELEVVEQKLNQYGVIFEAPRVP